MIKNKLALKTSVIISLGALSILTTGCASIVNGQHQSVSVRTTPVQSATCSLKNDKGIWYVRSTPGSVTIHRSYKELFVTCEKQGYAMAHKKVKSTTKPMAFGNVVFGGVIGAGVDMANGSAYDYPNDIQVDMHK